MKFTTQYQSDKKVIYLEKTDIGATLTTWIYCAFWQMWSAEQLGYDVYINWPDNQKPGRCLRDLRDQDKFREQPNMFNWYFRQPKTNDFPVRNIADIWTWENWKDPSPVSFMAQPLSVIKDYYKKNLYFSDAVNERGQELVDKYGIDLSHTIGITWRGTDNVTDGRPRMPIETYFPFIDQCLNHADNFVYGRIMATAEEEGILNPLINRYGSRVFTIDEFVSSPNGSKHNPERNVLNDGRSGFEKGLQSALMVWLFSKCAHYIKNRSSTGAVASWLSSGRIVSLGHPENLGFPANTDTAEIEGKLYPLYR